ncbi:ATP-binding cassette domain-containing protein [Ktedonosporobacter rubrisoli]|uniref:ATP-binding cassette domain-containing protein n=1 Tax=Ktedonosporobacter rubrisoli TaxID=2509675 RepID=A0A4P6K226_KTERU|nr:ABC transporter transmembrane domain-containing protein [Ktedonosporobacter rubrisoli]QBD82174.1 ATP-binding cassette domain-containing protein [Ktedonosporobacter rubrisoli]
MLFLCKFLYRNLKGYRFLIILAILVTISQVGSDLLAAMPLKFIPSKISNPGADPACTFPFLNGPLSLFDTPALDPSLRPIAPGAAPRLPPSHPCPANSPIPSMVTHHSVTGVIIFSLIILAIFSLLSALLVYIELFLSTFIAQSLSVTIREQLFDHLQRLSLDWHDRQKKGDLVQRVTGNIADIEKLVTDGLIDLMAGVLTLIGVATIMLSISPQYTLLSLAIAPVLFLVVSRYTGGIKSAAKKKARAAGKIADVATEDINALTVIRAFTLETRENRRFGSHVESHRDAGMRAGSLQAQFTPLVSVLVSLGTLIVVGVGGYVAAGNGFDLGFMSIAPFSIDVGTLILFLTYLKMLYQPMRDLSKLTTLATNAASGVERIQEVLDQAPEVIESSKPYTGMPKLKGEITFENVVFGYIKNRPVIKNVSIHIPAGRKVALVGFSGGGKTTLVKLIPRFYEAQSGSVKIDGLDNRQYPLQVLRQNVSLVLQEAVLFEGTIRENLEIGKPGAPMEEISDAARKANIHDFIMSLPDGYNTYVHEQGNNFSGGQRQRLAIARAILRDSPILILDEPTANLDVEAEAEVMHALNKLIVGRTVLTISHRLSTLGQVDEILVMRAGQIVERGSYRDLKRKKGLFASLLEEQNRYSADMGENEFELDPTSPILPALPEVTMRRIPVINPRLIPAGATSQSSSSVAMHEPEANSSQPDHLAEKQSANPHKPIKARVIVEIDGNTIGEYQLSKLIFTIGRFPTSDIQIDSQRVSRFHAIIRWKYGSWVIEDAESLNGLSFQGQRIEQLALEDKDEVHLDPTIILRYEELPQ